MTPSKPAEPSYAARRLLRRAGLGVALLVAMTTTSAWLLHVTTETPAERCAALLSTVATWSDHGAAASVEEVAASPVDLAIVDPALVNVPDAGVAAEIMNRLQSKPDRQRRLVLAYLAIGAAQDVRGYWRGDWVRAGAPAGRLVHKASAERPFAAVSDAASASAQQASTASKLALAARQTTPERRMPSGTAPSWLGPEIGDLRGRYRVIYWDRGWHGVLFGHPGAMLDQLVAMGFDGVLLDEGRALVRETPHNATAEQDMAQLVAAIASHARRLNPAFLVALTGDAEALRLTSSRVPLDGVIMAAGGSGGGRGLGHPAHAAGSPLSMSARAVPGPSGRRFHLRVAATTVIAAQAPVSRP